MSYNPRISEPGYDNKYYKHTSSGGVNECIHITGGSCLPNCVGYAWGRAYEIMKEKPKLSKGNAENWYNYNDGYERGQTPKLGAIVCFRKGKVKNESDGCGHVSVVEEIYNDGKILVSQSAYGGSRFSTRTLKPPYSYNGYTFQGFIYLPIETTETNFEYIVKKGDTLIGIANKYDTTYQELAEYNNIENPNLIHIGQVIKIPNGKEVIYTVQKGDTLIGIANKYNTSYQKIAKDNNIENPNLIHIGQKLVIK